MEKEEAHKLTQYSRGAGCGCKIAPNVLQEILSGHTPAPPPQLLVGYQSNDDAAVYDWGDGSALISTTDFFMPVVDDAFAFGRIAAANAISDVYAMGGTPMLALAVLGWPVEKLPPSLAQQVLAGAREVCKEANIPLAGGHSIDSAEPIFGLSVSGRVLLPHLKKNNTAREGDLVFITKALGAGILSTAQKRGVLADEHEEDFIRQLSWLNKAGEALGKISGVTAMTDITGFGLLGHLIEMAEGAALSATINYHALPVMNGVKEYLKQRIVPDATYRNWNTYSPKTHFEKDVDVMEAFNLLPDPQTNGGLMVACTPAAQAEVVEVFKAYNISYTEPIGSFVARKEKVVTVAP